MSSTATARDSATLTSTGATLAARARGFGVTVDAALAALLTVGFGLVVFVATGGTDLGPNTWVQIALLVIGVACVTAFVLRRASHRPVPGVVVVALFAALAALTYLSIAWSVQPATSWVEANRTLSYLAAFAAAAALARLAPGRWPAVVGAVGAVTTIVCAYALLTKVFPASLDPGDTLGRLRVPFDYWNATGLMAALGLPACLWAGTRPATGRVLRSLTVPALAVLLTTLVLSYSRGALLAAVLGLACWFALVPIRLRGVALLGVGAVFGAIATLWALAHHAITHGGASLSARTSDGHPYGLVLLAVVILGALAGFALIRAMDRTVLTATVRRRIGTVLLIGLALVPVVVVIGAAASSRGLTGQASHVWNELTSTTPSSGVGNDPGRLAQLSNSRPLYWREGLKVGEHAVLAGTGAGGFDTARTRYTTNPLEVAHAHSYAIETFADFGLIGIAVSLALLVAWGAAVRRTLGVARVGRVGPVGPAGEDPPAALIAERTGLITMLAIVVTYGVSGLIDWTWFIPGVTVPALVCAGWLAGRGALGEAGAADTAGRRTGPLPLGRAAAAIGVVAVALIAAWFVWQPLHSSDQVTAAINAITRGNAPTALAEARGAASSDPVSVDPLWELSAIYSAIGNQAASRAELVKATNVQPSNAETWQQLGAYDLQAHHPELAMTELERALRLDRTSQVTVQNLAQARAELTGSRTQTGSA
ncbi:MAG TPA: O-antigen ligase family protein [Solirubrobacteraceae bacterium]|nr:O-antigen ligase family protein [Solirubrobacteraceae bacterium]